MNGQPRMSMSTRASLAPSKKTRQSLANLNSLSDGMERLSMNPGARASLGNRFVVFNSRRSSVFNSRQSIAPAYPVKDPRNTRDKAWQQNAIKSLVSFLIQSGYGAQISPKTLSPPSNKEFASIFQFLYAMFDPFYQWTKFEEEAQNVLRALRYPYAESITKNSLISVGSPHAWPNLLAVLTWMVEMILVCDQVDSTESVPESTDLEMRESDKILYDFLVNEYEEWFHRQGNEYYSDNLFKAFERKNATVSKEVARMRKEMELMKNTLHELKSNEAPVVLLERENDSLMRDLSKLQDYNAHYELKNKKLNENILLLNEENEEKEKEINRLMEERGQLQQVVDSQAISVADVDRMNLEKDTLTKTLNSVNEKLESVNKSVWEKEISLQKKHDGIDKIMTTFNDSIYRLGLVDPQVSKLNLELVFNIHGSRPEQMIQPDLNGHVKSRLAALKSNYIDQTHCQQDQLLNLMEQIDRQTESVTEKLEELQSFESQIKKLNQQYNEEKENIGMSNQKTVSEIAALETEIARINQENIQGFSQSQQEVASKVEEYEKLFTRYTEDKESRIKSLVAALEELIRFRTEVGELLSGFKGMAEDEMKDLESEMSRIKDSA